MSQEALVDMNGMNYLVKRQSVTEDTDGVVSIGERKRTVHDDSNA
jgi:hypothetical protein